MQRKMLIDYGGETEPARYVCDVVRATLIFADPYHLAVFYELLPKRFSVVRVKNRFASPVGDSGYRDIMLNLLFEHEGLQMVVELQLALEMLVALKNYLHHSYEVLRHATRSSFLAAPCVFSQHDSSVDAITKESIEVIGNCQTEEPPDLRALADANLSLTEVIYSV